MPILEISLKRNISIVQQFYVNDKKMFLSHSILNVVAMIVNKKALLTVDVKIDSQISPVKKMR